MELDVADAKAGFIGCGLRAHREPLLAAGVWGSTVRRGMTGYEQNLRQIQVESDLSTDRDVPIVDGIVCAAENSDAHALAHCCLLLILSQIRRRIVGVRCNACRCEEAGFSLTDSRIGTIVVCVCEQEAQCADDDSEPSRMVRVLRMTA